MCDSYKYKKRIFSRTDKLILNSHLSRNVWKKQGKLWKEETAPMRYETIKLWLFK